MDTTRTVGGFPAAYVRRSVATDDSPGDASREAQESAVRRLCGPDVTIYTDWGISGRSAEKRPEYMRLKSDIAAGRVSSVCAYSLSRLGRNARELLSFIELCQANGVPVRTSVESVDTSTAMGRAMLTVMAAFVQLELEQGMERSAAARAARIERHEAAGLPMPGSRPIYGKQHVTENGITRSVDDPEHPIEPILAAYRDAGSVRGACELLQRQGIPAPEGGKVWGTSTLTRILDHYHVLPPAEPKRARRPDKPASAVFAGLLRCHCGRTLTPNTARKDPKTKRPLPIQYYCAAGRDSGAVLHGKYTVPESYLRPALEAEAARYTRQTEVGRKVERETRRRQEALEAAKDRWLTAYTSGAMSEARWRAETAKIDGELAQLAVQARGALILNKEAIPSWDDVPAMNRHLRRLWSSVDLDQAMTVAQVSWAIPEVLYAQTEIDGKPVGFDQGLAQFGTEPFEAVKTAEGWQVEEPER